jgi:hypothetical protein
LEKLSTEEKPKNRAQMGSKRHLEEEEETVGGRPGKFWRAPSEYL